MAQAMSEMVVRTGGCSGLFERVGLELQSLAGTVNRLQHVLTPLLADITTRDRSAMTHLQDLDLLEQSLHGLAGLMDRLDAATTLTDVDGVSDGIRTIRLAGLAARLSATTAACVADPASADLELF